jgi:lipopolysaccharide cholinephosphotransferase
LNFENKRRWLPKQGFEKSVDVEFEKGIYKAPANYDRWLKAIYGDYMKLPPEKDRKTTHNFVAYRR